MSSIWYHTNLFTTLPEPTNYKYVSRNAFKSLDEEEPAGHECGNINLVRDHLNSIFNPSIINLFLFNMQINNFKLTKTNLNSRSILL